MNALVDKKLSKSYQASSMGVSIRLLVEESAANTSIEGVSDNIGSLNCGKFLEHSSYVLEMITIQKYSWAAQTGCRETWIEE